MCKHKKNMEEAADKPTEPMQLPNSIAHRGQLAGSRQPTVWYSSNPIIAIIQGIVIGLLENSVPILLIPMVALVVIMITGAAPLLLTKELSHVSSSIVIAIWLGLQALVVLFTMSLHLQLMIASFHQERITVHQAIDRALRRPLGFFGVVAVCFGPLIFGLSVLWKADSVFKSVGGGVIMLVSYFIIARFWLAAFFFYDHNEDLKISLIDSWVLTKGRTLEMLGVIGAQIPMCVIGVLSPLVGSAGFTTRYFQLRYIKSHKLETSVKTHWVNFAMIGFLLLGTSYVVVWRTSRVINDRARVCYSVTTYTVGAQICESRKECRLDIACYSRELSKDPSLTVQP